MAHSLRHAAREPMGSVQTPGGTRFTVHSKDGATWQRLERPGEVSDYRVDYVIGSGNHASGYLIRLGDHLFQSPIAYYSGRHTYDLAPGYEKAAAPDFTRPVSDECLLCHSGKPALLPGSKDRYESPPFAQEAISCERCHGPSEEHLKRPVPGSIVNPAKLRGAARDSVCEQCHLLGVSRVLNPGKRFEDFQPGVPLEDVYTVYRFATASDASGPLKVISHSEQLAASACAGNSHGELWCGTCHDPHRKPAQPAAYFASRCLSCHAGKLPATHASSQQTHCVECHMPRREVFDGNHSVFTDHRIMRRPVPEATASNEMELSVWRQPAKDLITRNLALAYINAGVERNLPSWIVRGYRILTTVQAEFSQDAAVMRAFGTALLLGNQPQEAQIAFSRVFQLESLHTPVDEENAGRAYLASGDIEQGIAHLERALVADPLRLSAAELLQTIYQKQGDTEKQVSVAERVRAAMGAAPSRP